MLHYRPEPVIRLTTSFLAAVFICLHGRWHEITAALVTPMFYLALTVSFGVSYLLLYWIHRVSLFLDIKFPLQSSLKLRILAQLILGIVVPALADFLIMAIYFKLLGRKIFETMFLRNDFPMVLGFLIVANSIYMVWGRTRTTKKVQNKILEIDYNGKHLKLDVENDVLFFYRDRKLIRVYTISGAAYASKTTISQLAEDFEKAGFIKINPSTIVNLRLLQGYDAGSTRDTLQVIFKASYQEQISRVEGKLLRVTKEQIERFKEAIEKFTE